MSYDRRNFLKSMTAALGASTLVPYAHPLLAQSAKTSKVLLIGLHGGMSPFLGNAGAFAGTGWGGRQVTTNGQVSWDTEVFGSLMAEAAPYFGVAGSLGSGSHDGAKNFWYVNNNINQAFPVLLANAIGGNSTIKVAGVGPDRIPEQRYEQITNISSFLDLVGNSTQQNQATTSSPNYQLQADLLLQAKKLSGTVIDKSPTNLNSALLGITGVHENALMLVNNPPSPEQPAPVTVNPQAIMSDYGINSPVIGRDMASKLAAAEILLRTGVNVVSVVDEGGTSKWDTHDDNNGSRGRQLYSNIVDSLETFCRRMLGSSTMNVTVVLLSEHSRITEKSNHGPHTAVPIFSDRIVGGQSTGVTNSGGFILNRQPEQALRALVADLAMVGVNPFGTHGHSSLMRG